MLLIGLTLIGSGLTRRDLFLCPGNPSATAQPEPFLWLRKGIPWSRLAAILLVLFGIVVPAFLTWRSRPDFSGAADAVRFWPWAILTAALNAANEEFQFRSVILARLKDVAASQREAILISGVFFGLGHYFGQPSGMAGVLMAGFAGSIWAKSMIETRGFIWAFTIHFVQDVVIFAFLALSWVGGAGAH
jgi:membrane protease YdiL (CAAX protease family)